MTLPLSSQDLRDQDASIYHGRCAVLATMHGKEAAIAPPLLARLGLAVVVPSIIDTDALGTFSGEIPRRMGMLETAVAKAKLGMTATGARIGLASEGVYGPHPRIPFLSAGTELMVFVDLDRNIVVQEHLVDDAPVFGHFEACTLSDAEPQLQRLGFPEHAVMVRPVGDFHSATGLTKGIVSFDQLATAFDRALSSSDDRRVLVMSDMRADRNPTRMRTLGKLAARLADRVATVCPSCFSPGFGITATRQGLPCEWCGGPTHLMSHELFSCVGCDHEELRPRADGMRFGDPAFCPYCNP